MKMKLEHYNLLKAEMIRVKDKIPAHIAYLIKPENLIKIKDFDMRLRWDWFYYTKYNLSNFYSYLMDSHIDTALKQIVKEIEIN